MIDKLRDTSQSHDRCSVVEVMGRHAGYLALNVGIAVGATSILVPEVPYDFDRDILQRMKKTSATGKKHFIIIVAEGIGHVVEIAKRIEEETGVESRATILGHVQRGGDPTVRDRVLASRMGHAAVELLLAGKSNRVVTIQGNRLLDYDIDEALKMKKPFDIDLFRIAHEISI
jgi:6-phosphofructokinase 1